MSERTLNHSLILCPWMWLHEMSGAKRSTHAMKLTVDRYCSNLLIQIICEPKNELSLGLDYGKRTLSSRL
jgi:hypothetical protein